MSPVASAGCAPSFPVAGSGPLVIVSDRLLSHVTGVSPLSAVLVCPSSSIACGGPSSAVLGCLSSLVAGDGSLSAVSGCLSSLIVGSSSLSIVLGCPSSPVAGGSLWSAILGRLLSLVPPTCSRLLFLTSTPSYARCFSLPSLPLFYSFLPSLPTPLARNPALLTGKRSFYQAFITKRPISPT